MPSQTRFRNIWFIVVACLASCSVNLSTNDTRTRGTELLPTNTIAATQTINPLTATRTETPTPMSVPNVTLEATVVTVEPSANDMESAKPGCPTYTQNQLPLWPEGSILFGKGRVFSEYHYDIAEQPGIWAISADSSQPHLIYEATNWVSISPDGTTLLNIVQDLESDTQEVILYNLISGEEIHLTETYDSHLFRELWLEGRTQYGNVIERLSGTGEKRVLLVPDPDTGGVVEVVKELKLPDFAFNDSELDRGFFYGYESIDPTGQLILYTAQGSSGNNFEVRLLNLETGEILWQHDTQYLPSDIPQWSENGNRVLFVVNIPIGDTHDGWWKIISLTREGRVEELPPQPFPLTEEGQLNHYSRSLSGPYIFYTAWEVDSENLSSRNRAFVVNIETGEIGEICDPGTSFIASVPARDSAGHWLPDNQLVYRVLVEKEGQPAHSLRVLDIPSWTVQTIFEAEAGQGVNIFGWTQVEFP